MYLCLHIYIYIIYVIPPNKSPSSNNPLAILDGFPSSVAMAPWPASLGDGKKAIPVTLHSHVVEDRLGARDL